MAVTDWINAPTYTKDGTTYKSSLSTTQIQFRYEAVRSSDAKSVVFKIEPIVKHTNETNSDACIVYFTENSATSSSIPASFSHSCMCNKGGTSSKGPFYGSTGTTSSSSSYPSGSNSWASGNWGNISLSVAPEKTSVTLYFNFYNRWGRGNYHPKDYEKGEFPWKDGYGTGPGAQYFRFKATFNVPQGYTKNGSPTIKDTPELDLLKIEGLNTDIASSYFTANWTAPSQIGTNNAVSKYKIHVGVWGKPDGKTNGRVSYLYADNVSASATSYKIYRSTIKDKVGVDANTKYATSTIPSKYWECVDVQIEAVDKYGNSTYSDIAGWQVYWNEKPSAPTDIKFLHDDIQWNGNVVEMTDYYFSKVTATGSTDRWLPEFPTSYNEAKSNPAPYYSYLINRNSATPSDTELTDNWTKPIDGDDNYVYLDDNEMLGADPEIGLGVYYAHSKAWDGQLYSDRQWESFYLGRQLMPLSDENLTIESADGTPFSALSPSLKLVIPAMCVDGYDSGSGRYYYPSSTGKVGINIYASKENNGTWTDEYEVYSYSTKALQENESVKIPFSNFWATLLSGLKIDLTKPVSTRVRFSIYMYCENEPRLYGRNVSVPNVNHIIRGATITGELVSANIEAGSNDETLYYSYGQLTPYITTNVGIKYSISELPSGQYLSYYVEYADLGTNDSPEDTSVTWSPLYYGYESNVDSLSIVLPVPKRAKMTAVKLRLKVFDSSGNISYIPLRWPSYSEDITNAEKCAASAVYTYKMPTITFPDHGVGDLSITEDDDTNGNKVDFSFTIGDPLGNSDNARFFLLDWRSLFKMVGIPEYLCGNGSDTLVSAQYFSGVNPGKYGAPTFSGHLGFGQVNQNGSFLLNSARLKSSFDEDKEYTIIQRAVPFTANMYTPMYAVIYCSEVLKTTPGWKTLSDFDKNTDKLIQFNTLSINCSVSSYSNAKYEELNMGASEIKRKNGGALA